MKHATFQTEALFWFFDMSHRHMHRAIWFSGAVALGCVLALVAQQPTDADLGFKDTPMLPGQPWHVHDSDRPHPPLVTPGATPGAPPSDAVVLFDGKDLSKWGQRARGSGLAGKLTEPKWKVVNGVIETTPGSGDLVTRDKFGDSQIHIEWLEPSNLSGTSQGRGNSGVYVMSRYEIQVLDPWRNPTYADGQAGAIYGQWPPLVNPGRAPDQWQVYDIIFEAPKFEGEKVVKPVYFTVFFNGVVVQNHQPSLGPSIYRRVAHYSPHAPEEPLALQDHKQTVKYRNIWIRKLGTYDQPEKK
jgi:hypothetical protein